MQKQKVLIDSFSLTSLYLKLQANGNHLSTATGFIVVHDNKFFLITNWHVMAGRHPENNMPLSPTAAIPNEIRIAHHLKNQLGTWRFHGEKLVNPDGSFRWISHPRGEEVDVAALELTNIQADVQIYPMDLSLADVDVLLQPAMPVSVIGFPLGLRPNAFFPIWKTGHIATDPDLDYSGHPAFLIDATTRSGMSGSPVVVRPFGTYMSSKHMHTIVSADIPTKFLGVYSSRISKDVEVGCVWRPHVISEILECA